MQTGEMFPTVHDEDRVGSVQLFDLAYTGEVSLQPTAPEVPTVQLRDDDEPLAKSTPLTAPSYPTDSAEVIVNSDIPEITNGLIVPSESDSASGRARGGQFLDRFKGLLGRIPQPHTYDTYDDQQKTLPPPSIGQIDPLLHREVQATPEASLADLGSGTISFQGHNALNKAMDLAAETRQRELEMRKIDCQLEVDSHINLLEDIKTLEARAQSVFTPYEANLPVISHMADVIVDRASQIINTQLNLEGLANLSLEDDPAAWNSPGRAVLERLLTGQVEGVDSGLINKIAGVAVDFAHQLHGGKTLRYKDRQALKNPIKALDFLENEEAWEVLNAAVTAHAKEASTKAHGTLFRHITMLNDYSAEHRAQQTADESRPPHIMERDFNNLTTALGIENSSWQQVQDGSYVAGINIPYEPSDNNPLDRIIRRAGNKMRSTDTPGYSSFVALVEAPMLGGDDERWLILGSHPLITADSVPETTTTAQRNKVIARNTRETPHTSNGNVIQMPLSVWQLTARSYVALTEVIQDYGRPFADFRRPIEQSREHLLASVGLKTKLLKGVDLASHNALGQFGEMGKAIAESSHEVDQQLVDSLLGRVQLELNGAVQTVVPIAEIGPWQQQPPKTELVSITPPGTAHKIIDADVLDLSSQPAPRARFSNQATQELTMDFSVFDGTSQPGSFI